VPFNRTTRVGRLDIQHKKCCLAHGGGAMHLRQKELAVSASWKQGGEAPEQIQFLICVEIYCTPPGASRQGARTISPMGRLELILPRTNFKASTKPMCTGLNSFDFSDAVGDSAGRHEAALDAEYLWPLKLCSTRAQATTAARPCRRIDCLTLADPWETTGAICQVRRPGCQNCHFHREVMA
jgi:hypothetical protein